MSAQRKRIRASGRVQGVGFRWFVARAAARAGAVGWVQNLPDGGVLCEVQGEPAAVDAVERAMREGPPHAHVDQLEVEVTAPQELPESSFEIKRSL